MKRTSLAYIIKYKKSTMYNFDSEENQPKWKGILINALQKVHRQVHTQLTLRLDALEYVEKLILKLLGILCVSQPHTVSEVEERVRKTFPGAIAKWAIQDAQAALEKGKKKSPLVLPLDKIHPLLIKEVLCYKIDNHVSMYIVAVLEYIAADILKLASNYVKNMKHGEISCQDIQIAMCADHVLMEMFYPGDDDGDEINIVAEPVMRRESIKYEEVVKDLVLEENQYIRDLNMIIKVFRAPFAQLFPRSKDLDAIFSNIHDIYEFTVNFVTSIEDQVEATLQYEHPLIGTCFLERIEGAEFDIYEQYMREVLNPVGKARLNNLLQRADVKDMLQKLGPRFKPAVKYVLPKLLLGPIYHCLHYFEVLKVLIDTSPSEEDREILDMARVSLMSLRGWLDKELGTSLPKRRPWESSLRLHNRIGRPAAMAKMAELQKSIDGWVGKDICQSCSEFILEGMLHKATNRRPTERHVFLLDSLLIMCKQNTKRSSVTAPMPDYKLKEKFMVRKIEVLDKDDSEEYRHAFELNIRDSPSIVMFAKNSEDKRNWMAALVCLQTRSMLERQLDSYMKEEEMTRPLRLPDASVYKFVEEDSDENILCEESTDAAAESATIKGGTLVKLVERLTYHKYSDPRFINTFLTTYRSFCSPQELLGLLIQRYEIPDPPLLPQGSLDPEEHEVAVRDDVKRFRKEYMKPVQFRVINVLRHWVDQHFYDFERDSRLLNKLQLFLDNVKGKAMKTCAEPITRALNRRQESPKTEREFTYNQEFPVIEWHLSQPSEQHELMTLHPIEIARQVTLLEFDLYRAVKPSELVGCPWIKKDKNRNSPNLLKMIHFSTMFTFWLEKCIVETENFEERVAVMARIVEIMVIFQELNNFNGVLEIVSALNSAPVYRLENTFHELHGKLLKAFEEAKELNSDHFKKYIEKLRSINPPCVPFLGRYLTNILLTEEGNPDFLSKGSGEFINFSKRRKVAEFTGEIEQYQNQPYCLRVEPELRTFFEALDPLEGLSEKQFNDYLYQKSLDIEPRGCKQVPKYPQKRIYSLRSPGIRSSRPSKVTSSHPQHHTLSSATSSTSVSNIDTKPFQYSRIEEESDVTSPTLTATPPTPGTPLLSPDGVNNGVFQTVLFHDDPDMPLSYSTEALVPQQAALYSSGLVLTGGAHVVALQPPPIPPRRPNKERTFSEASFLRGALPPPVPPRMDSMTLPRTQSLSHGSQYALSATLPRRGSDKDSPHRSLHNVNGDDFLRMSNDDISGLSSREFLPEFVPELPPKSRILHSRTSHQDL